MELDKQFESVARELEELDDEIELNGLPDDLREVWQVETNVGTWNIPRSTAEFLYQLILIKRPRKILELGTSAGYSTIWLAAAAKKVGAEVVTIEVEPYKVETAKAFISRAGVADVVRQIHGDISEVLDEWDEPIDFVFMDANKRGYLSHLKKLEPHLSNSAILIADDAGNMAPNMEDFLEYVKSDGKYASLLLPFDHGLMLSVFNAAP